MDGFRHTPYAEGVTPFTIGLHPLDRAYWLEVDENLSTQLAEKARLDREADVPVFMEEPETRTAQQEALDLLVAHLVQHHGRTHRHLDEVMDVAGRRIDLEGDAPLRIAGHLVQEDLVLMRKNGDGSGWRIAAASLHFPSSWSLAAKFGKALADVHAPVPGFQRGTRNAQIIDRIFDRLLVDQPVWRTNFSLYDNPGLHHPRAKGGEGPGNGYGVVAPEMFIRCEYQTLTRLPVSGDILFTIRIHVDPMKALAHHPDRAKLCEGLAGALAALDREQMAYKGLNEGSRATLVDRLRNMGQGLVA